MDIYFNNEKGVNICAFHNVTTMPFKEGDIVNLIVTNENKDVWDVEPVAGEFSILSIKHYWRLIYPNSASIGVKQVYVTDVVVRRYV